MRKKNSRNKTKKEDTSDLEVPLNVIAVKLDNICYSIDIIDKTPVRFMWVSQHDKDFTTHFKSESEEYVLTFTQDDIIIKTSEELSDMILKDSKKKVKEVHNE